MAELYRIQGKHVEAEPLNDRSLAIDEKALGSEHPAVATTLNNLALVFDAQGRYGEAEPLYKRALAIWETALGPEHPDVATKLENYADFLRKTGRISDEKEMEARAKAIRAKYAKCDLLLTEFIEHFVAEDPEILNRQSDIYLDIDSM